MTSENKTPSIGWLNFGQTYLESAQYVWHGTKRGELTLHFDAPTKFLIGHSIELHLKGFLIELGLSEQELSEQFGHNLIKLYDKCNSIEKTSALLKLVQKSSDTYWRDFLRESRKNHIEGLGDFSNFVDTPDIQKIENSLPKIRSVLENLNTIFSKNQMPVKYLRKGLYQVAEIREFGLHLNVDIEASLKISEYLYEHGLKLLRSNG